MKTRRPKGGRKFLVGALWLLILVGCMQKTDPERKSYGVFLNVDPKQVDVLSEYDLLILDAQFFTKEEVEILHQAGCRVYSYINLGSVENFRPYYAKWAEKTLGAYEHWEEERWMDVADPAWHRFILESLLPSLEAKGVDGYFADNCDVYYQYPKEEIFQGLTILLKGIMRCGKPLLINGGDVFVEEYEKRFGDVKEVMTGINQETVFTAIRFENGTFEEQDPKTREYFLDYLDRYQKKGLSIYCLEYTKDEVLAGKIRKYCEEHGYGCAIADSLELGVGE